MNTHTDTTITTAVQWMDLTGPRSHVATDEVRADGTTYPGPTMERADYYAPGPAQRTKYLVKVSGTNVPVWAYTKEQAAALALVMIREWPTTAVGWMDLGWPQVQGVRKAPRRR